MAREDDRPARPREAFSLLGHDLRLDILLALLEGWAGAHTEPQRYSDLMRAVGEEDSGKFNYHLDRLRGAYLSKVDGGYVPTAGATALYRAVLAHRPTEAPDETTLDPGVTCPDCGEQLVATHEREFFTVRCRSCEGVAGEFTYTLPTNALEGRTDAAVLRTAYRRARSQVGLARTGQCPDCAGRTTVSVRREHLEGDGEPPVAIGCDTCTWTVRTGFLLPLLSDSRVARALLSIDVPVAAADPWELPDPDPSLSSTDPLEVELTVETDAGTAVITVDGALDVLTVS